MANYDGDRLYSNTIMKNFFCMENGCSKLYNGDLVSLYKYDSCGGRLVPGTILMVADLYQLRFL